jgi:hypothetical protein
MSKNIIFCADGTWNHPQEDEDQDSVPESTNVYKLFLHLAGDLDFGTLRQANEQEKTAVGNIGDTQCAKYIHGVGDSNNPIEKIMGGSFGHVRQGGVNSSFHEVESSTQL